MCSPPLDPVPASPNCPPVPGCNLVLPPPPPSKIATSPPNPGTNEDILNLITHPQETGPGSVSRSWDYHSAAFKKRYRLNLLVHRRGRVYGFQNREPWTGGGTAALWRQPEKSLLPPTSPPRADHKGYSPYVTDMKHNNIGWTMLLLTNVAGDATEQPNQKRKPVLFCPRYVKLWTMNRKCTSRQKVKNNQAPQTSPAQSANMSI